MHIGFAILLEDESFNFARQVELELCQKFGLCWGLKQSPHITIKAPFDTDKIEPFVDYLNSLAARTKPFEIKLEGFGYFEPKVIFLDVKENLKLKQLHFSILNYMKEKFKIEPHEFEGYNVKFHSAVALEDVSEEKFFQGKKYLKKYNPRFKFTAKTFGIFYYLGEDAGWIIARRIKISGH